MAEEPASNPTKAALYMVAASASFAAMAAVVKSLALETSVWATVWVRSVLVAVAALALLKARGAPVRMHDHRRLLVRSVSGFTAMGCYFWALGHGELGSIMTVQYTAPLFVALLAPAVVGEPLSRSVFGWLLVGFAGVVLVVRPGGMGSWGVGVALIGAVLSAVAYLSVRALRRTEDPDVIVLHFALVSVVLASPSVIELVREPPSLFAWVGMLAVGTFGLGGQLGMTRAYRYGDAARVSGFSYTSVALGLVFGALLFDEPLVWQSVAGAAVVAGAGIALARERQASQ